jgi:multisubunit Na+/H+ antiporter MnhB subunit
LELADEGGLQGAVSGGTEFVLEVLGLLVVDEEILFARGRRMVVAGAVGLIVIWQRLNTASDVAKVTRAVYFNEA